MDTLMDGFSLLWSSDQEIIGIVLLTLQVTLTSSAISACFGIPLGLWFSKWKFRGKRFFVLILKTMMGLPPVVVGLCVFLTLSRNGPLGSLQLLFTPTAMIIAQVLVITPIIMGLTYTSVKARGDKIRAFAKTMGANRIQQEWLIVSELRYDFFSNIMVGFSRAISEVGAVMIVGGNIRYKTRTMTTAISMLQNRGDYAMAIALGVILVVLAFLVQASIDYLRKEDGYENY